MRLFVSFAIANRRFSHLQCKVFVIHGIEQGPRQRVVAWLGHGDEELWKAYVQLTEAEAAFRIQKNDLKIRPIWHQRADRVLVHILVCCLAYVL